MQFIDNLLNRITMYRLVVYVLGILAVLGIVFSFFGKVSASPTVLVTSLSVILVAAYITDRGFGQLLNVPTNMESSLVSSLILFLIMQPATSVSGAVALAAGGAISSASKFILAWNNKHIFNPAAFAAAVLSLTGLQATIWWVGSSIFWPFTLVLGLAVVRKIRRFPLVITFASVSIVTQCLVFVADQQPLAGSIKHVLIASPLIFLATIMLTEPATMPPRRNLQIIFAVMVAVLYVMGWQIGPLIIYPEVALLIGNIFAFAVSPKFRVRLRLKEINKISDRVYDYVFEPNRQLKFIPGQYMDWTLPGVSYDSRGNRRTFTIASSPTEDVVHLGVKYYEPASMYKAKLIGLKPGATIYAGQIAGNFTLDSGSQKLAFIAGGIGITPFRSMVKYLTDKNLKRDIILLYVVSNPQEFAYVSELRAGAQVGIKIIPVVTNTNYQANGVVTGKLGPELIERLVPDYNKRTFYVSGSSGLVDATHDHLKELKIPSRQIKTDHFSGY